MHYQIKLSTINLLEFYGLLNKFIKECHLSQRSSLVNTDSAICWSRSPNGQQYREIYNQDTFYTNGPIFSYKDFIFNEESKKI